MLRPRRIAFAFAFVHIFELRVMLADAFDSPREHVTAALMRRLEGGEAGKSIRDRMKECFASAADDAASKACRSSKTLKDSIANATGVDPGRLKDSDARKILRGHVGDGAFASLGDCKSKVECLKRARNSVAEATGIDPEAIKDADIERDIRDGATRDFVKTMRACMSAAAGDEQEMQKCVDQASAAARDARPSREEASSAEAASMLRDAAAMSVAETQAVCARSNDADCEKKIKDEIALQLGKKSDDLTKLDVKSSVHRAAVVEAVSEARACREAKSDDANASCTDLYDLYVNVQGGSNKTGKAKKIGRAKMKFDVAAKSAAMSKRTCFERKTKDDTKNCLDSVDKLNEATVSTLFDGQDASKVRKMRSASGDRATTAALGSVFADCMKAAKTKEERRICHEQIEVGLSAANVTEGKKAFLQKYRGQSLADAVAACGASDAKDCRKLARKELQKSGMEEREFRGVKLLGATKAAATDWASCRDVEDEATCDEIAKQVYLATTGGEESAFSEKVQGKVRKLGMAILNGEATEVRLKDFLDVGISTDESGCTKASENTLLAAVRTQVEASDERFDSAKSHGCSLFDGLPEYAISVASNGADIASAANSTTNGMVGYSLRRLKEMGSTDREGLQRRLATTSEVFAGQAQEECSVDDNSCGSEDSDMSASRAYSQRFSETLTIAAAICIAGTFFPTL